MDNETECYFFEVYDYIIQNHKKMIRDFLECVTDQLDCEQCSLNKVKQYKDCKSLYRMAIAQANAQEFINKMKDWY